MTFLTHIRDVFLVTYVPWCFMNDAIEQILNTQPEVKQKDLLRVWRKAKLTELNFVGLTGALIAATGAATFSWPMAGTFPWSTKAFLYASLVFALMAISIATQQGVALSRISSHVDVDEKVRGLLGREVVVRGTARGQLTTTRWRVHGWQEFVWQIPTMLLGTSIVMFLVGLTVLIAATARSSGRWDGDAKLALCFAITLVFAVFSYMVSWYHVEFKLHMSGRV